ncbi:MAG: carboxylating nicotinate-nucleotide diphosphorylase [Balneola sp.]|nr:MAG: carboxylating nicotinate-nucleotide diphosphorylase [Balneola sp.]
MNPVALTKIIANALSEDLGMGDLTTNAIFESKEKATGIFTAKADGVLAGLDVVQETYNQLGELVSIDFKKKDGDAVSKGEEIATVQGSVKTLLSGERVILNLVQHMSGIATQTAELVAKLDDPSISVVDTRKTLPGLRVLQKYAVSCGGGKNHRFRLDDGIMIKDNHIKAAGGIKEAIAKAQSNVGHMIKIEVETESKAQVLEAVEHGADVIMLDNRSPEEVKEMVGIIPDSIIVEISGGITSENISTYKGCGAHVISVGALTHSVKALDISFNLHS